MSLTSPRARRDEHAFGQIGVVASRRDLLLATLGLLAAGGARIAQGAVPEGGASSLMKLRFETRRIPLGQYEAARARLLASGAGYPVLISDEPAELAWLATTSPADAGDPTKALLQRALRLDPEAWLEARRASDPEYFTAPRGEPRAPGLRVVETDQRERDARQVTYAIVPARHSWELPCYLPFGGWNECPMPEEHSAVLRRWESMYGASIAEVSSDYLGLDVKRPPDSREEAMKLAEEQFVYCPDIVYQGTGTIDGLAAALRDGTSWFLWWD